MSDNDESCIGRADAPWPQLRASWPSRYNPVELSRFAVVLGLWYFYRTPGSLPKVFDDPTPLPLQWLHPTRDSDNTTAAGHVRN